jgi:hypothetical protein
MISLFAGPSDGTGVDWAKSIRSDLHGTKVVRVADCFDGALCGSVDCRREGAADGPGVVIAETLLLAVGIWSATDRRQLLSSRVRAADGSINAL